MTVCRVRAQRGWPGPFRCSILGQPFAVFCVSASIRASLGEQRSGGSSSGPEVDRATARKCYAESHPCTEGLRHALQIPQPLTLNPST